MLMQWEIFIIKLSQLQRIMPSFHKSKQIKMKDKLKRFQFNPQPPVARASPAAAVKQKISDIIIRDQNGEFSSVKERNDFNDSSWLAKLVNGIEESENPSIRPLSQILNLQSMVTQNIQLKTQGEGEVFTITRKNSDSGSKKARKSVPCIYSQRNQNKTRDNSKLSCHTITMQNEVKKEEKPEIPNRKSQKRVTEQSHNRPEIKKGEKQGRNVERIHKKFNRISTKQDASQAHKNSLINYSSIEEDERDFDTHKNDSHQKIIIDLDEISLKTETEKEVTPLKNKSANQQNRRIQNKENNYRQSEGLQSVKRRSQSLKCSENYKQSDKIRVQDKGVPTTPVTQKQNWQQKKEDHKEVELEMVKAINVPKVEVEQPKQVFSSYNQFLDTFKHDKFKDSGIMKIGMIKKNNGRKVNQSDHIGRIDIKDIAGSLSSETRIPTFSQRPPEQFSISPRIENVRQCPGASFSPIKRAQYIKRQNVEQKAIQTIKKGENPCQRLSFHPINRQREVICHEFTKESPKFNYRYSEMTKNTSQRSLSKRINYQELFRKLDGKREMKIHKSNCKEESLSEEQKYQIGSILSKIKYMGKEFTQNEFVKECFKLMNIQLSNEETLASNYQTFHPYPKANQFKENIPIANIRVADRKNSGLTCQRFEESRIRSDATFVPLFPETFQTCTQNLAPRRSAYLQMPSFPLESQKSETLEPKNFQEKSDIGIIIDSLNSKLSNYIQTNNLEDTYRKFKLEFVQLRRNMQY